MPGHATRVTKTSRVNYINLDEARLRPHLRNDQPARQPIIAHTHPTSVATAAGDAIKLRGIPAIGRSVSGAIRGTQPDLQTERETR
jgi:hypothetical protein